jgi:ech hydrogenase subunit C
MVVTGSINHKNVDVLKNIYDQMPEPKAIVAIGACATSGGVFHDCYNVIGGVDKVLPVDVYVAGCCPKPESILDGILQAAGILEEKRKNKNKVATV